MSYQISLEVFEGPLDLLLHLIHKQKLDIYDIPIAQITQQYLDYMETMQQLDIEIASEFVVMAATLLSIKAKMLLPRKKEYIETEEDEPEDPRIELVERLAEYEKFKKLANLLKEMGFAQSSIYFRPRDQLLLEKALKQVNPLENVTLADLQKALEKVLAKASKVEEPHEIVKAEFTINDKIEEINQLLEKKPGGMIFQNLFSAGASRLEIVMTFLALLELIKLQKVKVQQSHSFGPILILPSSPLFMEGEVRAV